MSGDKKFVTVEDVELRHFITYTENLAAWHKHLTTLASGGLTLLVSLQGSYVPADPSGVSLLKACWVFLAVSICAGLMVHFGRAQTSLDAANSLRNIRVTQGEAAAVELLKETSGVHFVERWVFQVARLVLPTAFLIAMVSLVWFAVLNVGQTHA